MQFEDRVQKYDETVILSKLQRINKLVHSQITSSEAHSSTRADNNQSEAILIIKLPPSGPVNVSLRLDTPLAYVAHSNISYY